MFDNSYGDHNYDNMYAFSDKRSVIFLLATGILEQVDNVCLFLFSKNLSLLPYIEIASCLVSCFKEF